MTVPEHVKRVAMALYKAEHQRQARIGIRGGHESIEPSDYYDDARAVIAAIAALREPTEAMIQAGVAHRLKTTISGENNWSTDTAALWRAMVDEILRT